MDDAEVKGGIAPSSSTLAGHNKGMLHQSFTLNHENTARRPIREVLPAYAKIGLDQSFKLAP